MMLVELMFLYLDFDAAAAVADMASRGISGKHICCFRSCCYCTDNDMMVCMMIRDHKCYLMGKFSCLLLLSRCSVLMV
jgi:hypothetical protein